MKGAAIIEALNDTSGGGDEYWGSISPTHVSDTYSSDKDDLDFEVEVYTDRVLETP